MRDVGTRKMPGGESSCWGDRSQSRHMTRAEVLTGAAIAQWGRSRTAALRAQLDRTATVPVTSDVVEAYVQLTADLKANGHALQQKQHTGDRWVAATAIAVDAPLFSADGIYRGAPGLVLLDAVTM